MNFYNSAFMLPVISTKDEVARCSFDMCGFISSKCFEILCSILLGSPKGNLKTIDLADYEVKSAIKYQPFKYEFSKIEKFELLCQVDHVLVYYDEFYNNMEFFLINKNNIRIILDKWLIKYKNKNRQYQIEKNEVIKLGEKILIIENGQAILQQ